MTSAATQLPNGIRSFTAVGKHECSSEDDSDRECIALPLSHRKRRRTLTAPLTPSLPGLSDHYGTNTSDSDEVAVRNMLRRRRNVGVPAADKLARQRCFEYLLSAIDAAWAEYCNSTSYAESQIYMPCSPVSEGEYAQPVSPRTESVSLQPQSQRLMRLKARLLDAKYFLTDIVGSHDPDASSRFWKRWDECKYAAAELVEGDDEDTDNVLEELENGRYYV